MFRFLKKSENKKYAILKLIIEHYLNINSKIKKYLNIKC